MEKKQVLAFSSRQQTDTETLKLTAAQIAELGDGLKSGTFITQISDNNRAVYALSKTVKENLRIDGIIAFDIAKADLKEGEILVHRVSKGIIYKSVIEAANDVVISDLADGNTTYKTLLEKQGFEIVNSFTAN
ncbi:MAG: hypothetical protein FWF51_06535 [Chitinivibrionia bacterium]|nr:hypothetical protein [Chitinivibrionia bacterium]